MHDILFTNFQIMIVIWQGLKIVGGLFYKTFYAGGAPKLSVSRIFIFCFSYH